jgi:hypothetical protein
MKKSFIILGLALVCCSFLFLAHPAFAKEAPEAILAKLPAELNGFQATQIQKFDEAGWGAALGYNNMDTVTAVTVYIFDMGAKEIKDGLASPIIKQAKTDAMEDIKSVIDSGMYKNLKIVKESEVKLPLGKGKSWPALYVLMNMEVVISDQGLTMPDHSSMYITGMKNQIIKIRISRPEVTEENEKNIDALVSSLLSAISGS